MARALALLLGLGTVAAQQPIVVTGATGKTGQLLYKQLKDRNLPVRALVRNVTKARELLGCTACDASEGIFIGDVTEKASLAAVMEGAGSLAIVTSSMPSCSGSPPKCVYPKGAYPVDVDFNGGKAQVEAFAEARKAAGPGHVVLCSSMGTTEPDSFLDKLGNGNIGFFKLNEEAALMSAGMPFTIVKPCGLLDTPGGQNQLVVGHDDEIKLQPPTVARADVARVMLEALLQPSQSRNLRFDLCSKAGTPTTDFAGLFNSARWPTLQDGLVV